MPPTSPNATLPRLTQLLVSVRNVREAEICWRLGVDWIDVKEPSAGSLGAPSLESAQAISAFLFDFPKRSVALGELATLNLAAAKALGQAFPVVKVGLSELATGHRWQRQLDDLANEITADLVPVAYADWKLCNAPSPAAVLDWACGHSSRFMLVDTFTKNGLRLLDYVSVERLEEIVAAAHEACVGVVLAGSLSKESLAAIQHIPCAAIAVRGAVCRGSRDGAIDEELVGEWVRSFAGL
jgi:(5-formylfuran-3-yl)methyl phosphate synthase